MGRVLHVDYVSDRRPAASLFELLGTVLADPLNVLLFALGGAVGVVAVLAGPRILSIPDVRMAQRTLASYRPYLGWMLRLSLGLPLVGSGFAGYFISPSVPVEFRIPQVMMGFLLLFGLFTRGTAAVGLVAYLVGLAFDSTLFLAFEYVGGFLGILLVGPGQPSADGMLRRVSVTDGTLANRYGLSRLFRGRELLSRRGLDADLVGPVVRFTLGVNFMYLGVSQKLLNSGQALAVVDRYDLTSVVPVSPEMWVAAAGLSEFAVGFLLLLGVGTRGVATVAFVLFTTTLFGLPDDPVLAHVSLFGLASALLVTGSGPYEVGSWLNRKVRARLGALATPAR
jgi:uncharacterized membrane protein YphA (DoxX/SURF4 family)